jgi:L-asparaginase II
MPAVSSATPSHVPLTVVSRGGTVESVHSGSIAVVDSAGNLLFAAGDPEALTFTRSTLKPLQALPFVAAGGVERFGYAMPEVALLCASHSGEPRHIEAAASMLAKAGNTAADLQ